MLSWAPFAWSAVRQRSSADAALAAVSFAAVICMVPFGSDEENGLVIGVLLTLMLGGSVLAGVRTPRAMNVPTGSKAGAAWLVAASTVAFIVMVGALAPSEPSSPDESAPPTSSPAPSPGVRGT
jgi:peptidoglycan/LPS O-acetylase OafA/YrhL